MDINKAKLLLEKYLNGTCTLEEKSLIEKWYNQFSKERPMPSKDIDFQSLGHEIFGLMPQKKTKYKLATIAAAACILVALSIGVFQLFQNVETVELQVAVKDVEIVPGGNKATLTSSDGLIIDLNNDKDGIVLLNDKMTYNDGTLVQSEVLSIVDEAALEYTISTPKGGQYQIVLPDGTKVWLNAASSLKYPATFTDSKMRKVELTGEAYFEVKNLGAIPFIVKTTSQEIKVLGTQFNVNAYEDEIATKTSLIEGSVLVSVLNGENIGSYGNDEILLKPNQQSVLPNGGKEFQIEEIDASAVVAWKEGFFNFNKSDMPSVMRELARWYNVDVSFEGSIPQTTFSGKIYRNAKMSKIYDLLDYYKIKYSVEGRHIKINGVN